MGDRQQDVHDLVAVGGVELAGGLIGQDESGPIANTRATATRWACPPESSSGNLVASSVIPTCFNASTARPAATASGTPAISSGSATFSRTSSGGTRLGPWNTTPSRRGRGGGSSLRPGQLTSPVVGSSSPASKCSRVVLPEPDAPVSAIRAPGETRQLTDLTAPTAPGPLP